MAELYVFCEGSMQKKEAKGKWVTYYCVLRGDRLWCFMNKDTKNPHSLVGSIKMTNTTQLKKHKTKEGNFQFKIRNDRGEYRFRCTFSNDRDRWLVEIGKCARGEIPGIVFVQQQQQQQQQPQALGPQASMGIQNGPAPQSVPLPDVPRVQPPHVAPFRSQQRPQMEVPNDFHHQSAPIHDSFMMTPDLPSESNLLPGQRLQIADQRRSLRSNSGLPNVTSNSNTGMSPFTRGAGSSSVRSMVHPSIGRTRSASGVSSSSEQCADQEWFYGKIHRELAEDYILNYGIVGSFLLRESESPPGSYSLSFKSEESDVRHYKITCVGLRYTLTGLEERTFGTLLEVVQYYVQVNEGWASALKRSDTGYNTHTSLKDDAIYDGPGYTSGFDRNGGVRQWTPQSSSHGMNDAGIMNDMGLRSSPNSSGSMGTPTWNGPGSSSQGRVVPPPPCTPPPNEKFPPPPSGPEVGIPYPAFEEGFPLPPDDVVLAFPPPPPMF